MIVVIRHAQKGPDGNLTKEGVKVAANVIGKLLDKWGGTKGAVVASNERARQTAIGAGLKIMAEEHRLAIPDGYEEYINKVVVARMLDQSGERWEQSYT